jgi:hypothetical protein
MLSLHDKSSRNEKERREDIRDYRKSLSSFLCILEKAKSVSSFQGILEKQKVWLFDSLLLEKPKMFSSFSVCFGNHVEQGFFLFSPNSVLR